MRYWGGVGWGGAGWGRGHLLKFFFLTEYQVINFDGSVDGAGAC